MQTKTLGELFTDDEIQSLLAIVQSSSSTTGFISKAVSEVIEPAMPEINRKTGQENDAHYLEAP